MSGERREYYRIDDQVILHYRRVGEQDVALILDKLQNNRPDRFTVAANFAVTSRQLSHLLQRIRTQNPDLGMALDAMDRKMNLLAQLLVTDEVGLDDQQTLQVSLSGGGMAFNCPEELALGELIETRLVLYPHMTGILALSRVVSCQRRTEPGVGYPWRVALEYEHLREQDRDLLCKHILDRQMEERRAARESADL